MMDDMYNNVYYSTEAKSLQNQIYTVEAGSLH